MLTQLGGEYRFASSAAKRLQSLGALLRGDRRAVGAGAELSSFDVDTLYGKIALTKMLEDIRQERFTPMKGVILPDMPNPDITFGAYARQVRRTMRVGVVLEPEVWSIWRDILLWVHRLTDLALPSLGERSASRRWASPRAASRACRST